MTKATFVNFFYRSYQFYWLMLLLYPGELYRLLGASSLNICWLFLRELKTNCVLLDWNWSRRRKQRNFEAIFYTTFTSQWEVIINSWCWYVYNITLRGIMIICYLDLQLPMQSVPITSNVVSLNPAQARCTRYNINVCQWFSLGTAVSSTNKTDHILVFHDITEILLKVALNTINLNI